MRNVAGNPVPSAHIRATWQVLWVEQNGRLVSTNQTRTAETDTGSDGSYLLCGFTRDARITITVGVAGANTLRENLILPASMVLEHDFRISGP